MTARTTDKKETRTEARPSPTGARQPAKRRRPALATVIIVIGLALVAGPIYWMVVSSFKTEIEATAINPTLIPHAPTVSNYVLLVTGTSSFPAFFANSLFTSAAAAVIGTFVCALAGYSFSRGIYRLRTAFSLSTLIVQVLPFVVLVGPLYLLLAKVNLLNSYIGLILGYMTFAMPFGAWMMKGFIDGLPVAMEDAARVDGYSRLGIFFRIILPLSVPGMVTTAVMIFINAWNNLLFPLVIMSDPNKLTLPPGLIEAFNGVYQFNWGGMMAATTVTSIPLVIAFFVVQRYMVRGLTAGAVAGT